MLSDYNTWHKHELGKRVVKNLKHNFFDAYFYDTVEEAQHHIQNRILEGMNVAFGGSMTVRQMNFRNYAQSIGATVIDHNAPGLSDEGRLSAMRQELTSDLFICSSNAITSTGYLVNVDGYGNRVAAMIFGPKKVIVVAGINKIVHSEQEAFKRIEFVAGPMNMKRLERRTPCGSDGTCHDCSSEDRGCRAYTVIRRRPSLTPTEVIIIGDILGM